MGTDIELPNTQHLMPRLNWCLELDHTLTEPLYVLPVETVETHERWAGQRCDITKRKG